MSVDTLQIWKQAAPFANKTIIEQVDFFVKKHAANFGVDTTNRIAAFMSQAAHETAGFQTLREYASGSAYEGRKDLGNIYKGDGVKFRGRGIFQITGRTNYTTMSKKIFGDTRLLNNPAILEQPEYAVLSALHFWRDRNLNQYADRADITGLTKRINGGTNGLDDRLQYWNRITSLVTLSSPALFLASFVKKKVSAGWLFNLNNLFRSSSPLPLGFNSYE